MQVEDKRNTGLFERIKQSAIVKKLRSVKNIQIIALIFIIAVGLIIYSNVMSSKDAQSGETSTVMNGEEQRLSSILGNIEGAGKVEVMISKEQDTVKGVLIIADGADSITVRIRLIDAASTALGVDRRIVNVFSRK